MSAVRGEGRGSGEKSQGIYQCPESRTEFRERMMQEELAWVSRNGITKVKRFSDDRGTFLLTHKILREAPMALLQRVETLILEAARERKVVIEVTDTHDGKIVRWYPDGE